jgi:hypothetical protein
MANRHNNESPDILPKGHSVTLPSDTSPAPPEPRFNHLAQGTGKKDMARFAKLKVGWLAGEGLAETVLLRWG